MSARPQLVLDVALEIGVEELPAAYIEPALEAFRAHVAAALTAQRLPYARIEALATPRRLILLMYGVATRQEAVTEQVMGPALKVAFDASGAPTKAALGFAKGQGIDIAAIETVSTEKGDYIAARVVRPTLPAADVLAKIVPEIAASLPAPKSMTWEKGVPRFARPVRWIVALAGADIIPLRVFGLDAGRATFGHRLLSPGTIDVPSADVMVSTLESVKVDADIASRRTRALALADTAARELDGRIVRDDELADIVTQMIEWPAAVAGRFDAEFLELPREVIVTAMREHQRYFAVEDMTGTLLPGFVCVTNGVASDSIRVGHERVLRARLADARFHYLNDQKKSPEALLPALEGVVWIEGLGSVRDRTERLRGLVRSLAPACGADAADADRAALLAKTDLVSDMLQDGKEYTALQGIIGATYAAKAGEPARVCDAMRDQYKPAFAGDAIPSTREGVALALADKLDLLAGCFLTGRVPTGAQDPFGVRRATLGTLRLLIERGVRVRLDDLLRQGMTQLGAVPNTNIDEALRTAMHYIAARLDVQLRETGGVDADLVDATIGADAADPVDALERAQTLARGRASADLSVAAACARRAANFLKDVPAEDGAADLTQLTEPAETTLLTTLMRVEAASDEALSRRDYDALLRAAMELRDPVDAFFTAVLVLDPDAAVRARRIALVRRVDRIFHRGWDMSRLQSEARPVSA